MSSRNDLLYNWFEYGIDHRRRLIRIDEDINEVTASYAISGLTALDSTPGAITIQLTTYGGECWPGMGIYDAIKGSENHITIEGSGYVMSMGTVILQAADERVLTPNTDVLIHVGTDGMEGHSVDFQRYAEFAQKFNARLEDIYLERIREKNPRFTRKQLQSLLQHDTYLTPTEAVKLGLADSIKE